MQKFLEWFEESFGSRLNVIYRENILDYISYLRNIKRNASKTINAKISALMSYNKYLIENGVQESVVIYKTDKIRIQERFANLSDITKQEVEIFRQNILENESKLYYCLVTIMAYTGIRISEAINIRLTDFNLQTRELVIVGKGNKERIVYLNDKIINSLREYIKERDSESEYLFYSRQSEKINRTTVNKLFNKYSNKITPHSLRHFFCSNAIESGFSVHEVANLAGHTNIHTTLIYTNPSKEDMKRKVNSL